MKPATRRRAPARLATTIRNEAMRSIVEANGPDEGGPDLVPVATLPYRGTVNGSLRLI